MEYQHTAAIGKTHTGLEEFDEVAKTGINGVKEKGQTMLNFGQAALPTADERTESTS